MPGKEKQPPLDEIKSDQSVTLNGHEIKYHQILYEFLVTSVNLRQTKTIKKYYKRLYLFYYIITGVIPVVFHLTTSNKIPIFSLAVQQGALLAIYIIYLILAFIITSTNINENFIILLIRTLPVYIVSVLLINLLQIFFDWQSVYASFIIFYIGSIAVLTAFSFIVLFKKNNIQRTIVLCLIFFLTSTIPLILMDILKK